MITPELVTYIRKLTLARTPKENIVKSLMRNGWSAQDIKEAFAAASTQSATSSSAPQALRSSSPGTGVKIFLSVAFITTSTAYAFFQYIAHPQQLPVVAASIPTSTPVPDTSSAPAIEPTQQPSGNTTTVVTQTPVVTAPPPKKTQTTTPAPVTTPTPTPVVTSPAPVTTPAPAPKPVGEYADGTYTGSPADAYYGTVKVQAVIQGGKLTAVNFLSYPNDRNTSRYINSQAMPQLKTEAIQAQSANVDGVSGATDTSQAFIQSLGSALAQAKN